jgi:hypothetical protein
VSAPRKYEQEFRDRAVRMYRDRLAEPGESVWGAPAGAFAVDVSRAAGHASVLERGALIKAAARLAGSQPEIASDGIQDLPPSV